jgi:dCMP deaminase
MFMTMAYLFAMRSPDTSTQVGCVVADDSHTVVSMGYNGWPRNVAAFEPGDARFERPEKYLWMEHAERNAVYNACRMGTPLDKCTIYVTMLPCADCARAIVQVGMKRVVYHEQGTELMKTSSSTWDESHQATLRMFAEAGIELVAWAGDIIKPRGMFRGQILDLILEG